MAYSSIAKESKTGCWTGQKDKHLVCNKNNRDSIRRCAVTQHTTACCSTQVIDITLAEHRSASITSLRVVQQKHSGAKYTYYYKPKPC
jgi:hypothetical protein